MTKRNEEAEMKTKLDNGYPFREDIINFSIKYRGKEYYFEFPVLMDKSFLLREIKSRTGVRGTFCLQWKEFNDISNGTGEPSTQEKRKCSQKPKRLADVHREKKGEEVSIHSSYLTTLALARFCGQTLKMISAEDGRYQVGENTWLHFSHDPMLEYKRQVIQHRLKPFDCPP